MGTNKSSESDTLAAYLRSQRTTTQWQVDRRASAHDVDSFSAASRFAATQAHTAAAAAAH